MKKYLAIIILGLIWGCSEKIDTSQLSPEAHYDYAMSLYNEEDYEYSIKEFQSILLQYPGSTVNDDAQYYLGMSYFQREQYLLAGYEYSKLIRDIPASEYVPSSQFMLAESYYQLSPPYQLDQAYSKKAINEFQAFIDYFPTDPKVEEAERKISEMHEKLAEKEYNSAIIYEKIEYYNAAMKYYDYVVNSYHDTKFAPMALYNKIQILLSKERVSDALNDISNYITKYPDNEKIEEMKNLQEELLSNE